MCVLSEFLLLFCFHEFPPFSFFFTRLSSYWLLNQVTHRKPFTHSPESWSWTSSYLFTFSSISFGLHFLYLPISPFVFSPLDVGFDPFFFPLSPLHSLYSSQTSGQRITGVACEYISGMPLYVYIILVALRYCNVAFMSWLSTANASQLL